MRIQPLGALAGALTALPVLGCAFLGADSPVVAEGADLSITLEQLDERVKQDLLEERTGGHEARLYELRSDVLDEWIEEQVLENEAERRGVDVETLLAAETAPITQEEVQAFFDQNAARLPAGTTLADVEEPIRQHLGERKRGEAIAALVNQADVQVHLDPPRIDVAAVGPSLGPDDAPVTIIEFGDFQCPYCRRAAPTMQALRERYPQRVRFVYRHLPLESIHPRARAAAEAAICADAQDRFWAFHDRLFAAPGALGDAELRAHAEAVGVDLDAFDACLSEGSPQARIASDIQAARDAGISGTPAFVINGMLVTGAQPIEVFDELIQRDLAAAERAP